MKLPHSIEAEQAVIGSLLINPSSMFSVSDVIGPDDFFVTKNGYVFDAFQRAIERGVRNPNYMDVVDELDRMGVLNEIGGAAYLTEMLDKTPTSFGVSNYAKTVFRKSWQRRAIQASAKMAEIAYVDDDSDVEDRQARIEQLVFGLAPDKTGRDFVPIRDTLDGLYDDIDRRSREGPEPGVLSEFYDLDKMTGGWQKSDLIILAARPSMGKTASMLQVAYNAATTHGKKVAFFSLEMSAEQVALRLLANETKINSQKLRQGAISSNEWATFISKSGEMSESGLFICDIPNMSVTQTRAKLRRLCAEYDIDLVIIDYIQLMMQGKNRNGPVAEMSHISRTLKGLAREFELPVIVGSQLSRACEQRQDKRPMLSDLRESGAIEQDADIVMFIYRDVYYNEETEFPKKAEILIRKHRNGPTGTVTLGFEQDLAQFFNIKMIKEEFSWNQEPPRKDEE